MKNFAIILLLLCCKANCQTKFKFDTSSFLLGLLEDYNGRNITLEKSKSAAYIATVRPEFSKMFLDSITKLYDIPKSKIEIEGNSFFNKNIAQKINQFFTAKINSGMVEYDAKEDKDYNVYFLQLNETKFDTNAKKLSFLTGIFYNCGKMVNNQVIFETANSTNFENAVHFISALGFGYCEAPKSEYTIPTVQSVTFTPSSEYLDYFLGLELRRKNVR
jgi:hypothetical protein